MVFRTKTLFLKRFLNQKSPSSLYQKRALTLSCNVVRLAQTTQPPLLMIHGLLGNKNNFNSVRKLLQERLPNLTVITCDVRNHGESPHSDQMDYASMSEDTLQLLHTLKIDKCMLLGHSLGGRIAMHTALTKSSIIDKLIVVDVSPGSKGRERGISEGPIQYVKAMKGVQLESGLKRSQARASASQQLTEGIPDRTIRDFALTNLVETSKGCFGWRINLDAVLQNAEDFSHLGDDKNFSPFQGKTLFLGGEKSDYITSSDHPDIKRLFPNAIIKTVPNCGHWVHADKPFEFVSHIADFISD